MSAASVAVLGNVGIDTTVFPPGGRIDWAAESNFTENLDSIGQAGGFTSRGYARLGFDTAFIGHVGEDPFGTLIRETFRREGIDVRGLAVDPAGTCRSVNLMDAAGGRKSFYDGKGHHALHADPALCRAVMAGRRLAHVHLANWTRELLPLAKALGMTLAVDLQDLPGVADPYRRDHIEAADLLFFSAVHLGDPEPALRALREGRPDRVVVAGMGALGCAVASREGIRRHPPVAMDRPVVDTNGAGDGLAVGFLSSFILEGRPLEESIRRGQIAARYTCSLRGTSDGLITREQLDRYARG